MKLVRRRIGATGRWAGVVVSLLLAVGWFVTGWLQGGVLWNSAPGTVRGLGLAGGAIIAWEQGGLPQPAPSALNWTSSRRNAASRRFLWFSRTDVWTTAGPKYRALIVPLWAPLLPVAGVTAWRWAAWRVRKFGSGRCGGCGYDLRGLGAGAVCPECGRKS